MASGISSKTSAGKTILLIGFVAGTLDICAAFLVYSYIMKVVTPVQILQGITSTAIGKTTIADDNMRAVVGLVIHYMIAYAFAILYFLIYSKIKFLHKSAIISGLLYGVFVWAVMNLIVVPLANGHYAPFVLNSFLRAIVILMICIGLPISIITANYYKRKA